MSSRKIRFSRIFFLIIAMALCSISMIAPTESQAASNISLRNCKFSWTKGANIDYSGSSWRFNRGNPSFSLTYNGRKLRSGQDYTYKISPKNNKWTAGQKQLIITGKGNYTGNLIKTYFCNYCNIGRSDKISYSTSKSGFPKKTYVSLRFYNKKIPTWENLVKNKDYTASVSYTRNRLGIITKSRVTFYGMGNFSGSKSYTFNGKVYAK